MKKIKILAIGILLITLLTPSVFAALGGMGISPSGNSPDGEARSIFTYYLDPGEHINDEIAVANYADVSQSVILSAVDATMTDTGGFALKSLDDPQTNVGTWIKLEKNKVTVKPGKEEKIKFTIDIPENLAPGDYSGGFLLSNDFDSYEQEQAAATGGAGVVSLIQMGIRIYISVSGERIFKFTSGADGNEAFTRTIDANGSNIFAYSYKNDGNINMDVSSNIELKNVFLKLDTIQTNLGTLLPGTAAAPKIQWADMPKIGFIRVKSTLNYQPSAAVGEVSDEDLKKYSGSETHSVSFFILPIKELLATIAIFILSFIILFIKHIKFAKLIASCKESIVKKDDSLIAFASHNKIDWKLLAKINKIKSPYIITKGEKILIPSIQSVQSVPKK